MKQNNYMKLIDSVKDGFIRKFEVCISVKGRFSE